MYGYDDDEAAEDAREAAYAEKILQNASVTLKMVDDSFIIQQRGHEIRAMPTFRAAELSLGNHLGTGGFGIVNEVRKFTLDEEVMEMETEKPQEEKNDGKTAAASAISTMSATSIAVLATTPLLATETPSANNTADTTNGTGHDNDTKPFEISITKTNSNVDTSFDLLDDHHVKFQKANDSIDNDDDNNNNDKKRVKTVSHLSENSAELIMSNVAENADNDVHYDISRARGMMQRRCYRGDICRYALKRLRDDLTPLEKARGMVDLAIEAKFLSVVWHPNIIKMRGMAKGPLVSDSFFIILDRLHGTLDLKINEWYKSEKNNRGICNGMFFGIGHSKEVERELLTERLTVAYDLAAAFFYLHENRLVYRDIKPENIGFDIRGDVKIFDFGLCKSLSTKLKAKGGYGYRLTGRAGSLPYMAPEVIKMETYDTKCDVYSFAILLWEMLTLRQAFKGSTPTDFVERVVVQKERLPIPPKGIPTLTRLMLPEAWDHDPRKRPDMKRVAILIRGDLNDMTTDERVLHRTRHMDNLSNASLEMIGHDESTIDPEAGGSVRGGRNFDITFKKTN